MMIFDSMNSESVLPALPALTLLAGLPPYGPPAISFPPQFGQLGREGTVVQFETASGAWVGNFENGRHALQFAGLDPNGRDAVVIAGGDLWIVDMASRTAQLTGRAVSAIFEVANPQGWVICAGNSVVRLGPQGIVWKTEPLSHETIEEATVHEGELHGSGWWPEDRSEPFRVNLESGAVTRGGIVARLVQSQGEPPRRSSLRVRLATLWARLFRGRNGTKGG